MPAKKSSSSTVPEANWPCEEVTADELGVEAVGSEGAAANAPKSLRYHVSYLQDSLPSYSESVVGAGTGAGAGTAACFGAGARLSNGEPPPMLPKLANIAGSGSVLTGSGILIGI